MALKGMKLSAYLVNEWINAFPNTCTVSDRLDGFYSDSQPGDTSHITLKGAVEAQAETR